MAREARRSGSNVIASFTYGQRGRMLGWDSVRWFGEGNAILLSDEP